MLSLSDFYTVRKLTKLLFFSIMFSHNGKLYANDPIDQTRYDHLVKVLANYRARFEETAVYDNFEQKEKRKGSILINYPSRFRIKYDYGNMKGEEFIGNGEHIIISNPDMNSAQRIAYRNYSLDEPLMYFFITKQVSDLPYKLEYTQPDNSLDVITLSPLEAGNTFKSTKIVFKNNMLVSIKTNSDDWSSEYTFLKIDTKSKIQSDEFKFVPPEGVDFFETTTPD